LNIIFPFVFKLNVGGEGESVFLIKNEGDLKRSLKRAAEAEKIGIQGLLFQEYIPHDGKCLRITVIGDQFLCYWRIQKKTDVFYVNMQHGAQIEHDLGSAYAQKATSLLKDFCLSTGINMAGFDCLFRKDDPMPLFLEINYFFGRQGLGGSFKFYELFEKAVERWLVNIGLSIKE
ncbi:MAG: glutathione synthase, partial [Pseudomonadota bacterium]